MHRRRVMVPMGATAIVVGCLVLYELRVLLQLSARPDPDADREFRFPGAQTHVVDTGDGGHLHVEECGSGRPVLLLHGHGASMRTFSLMAGPLAAAGCRVIAMDQRGFGRSSPVPPLFGFSGLVRDTATVLDALDLRGTVVVGHSMGGGVALGLAIDSPETVAERVAAIVLINSSGRGPADRPVTRAKVTALDLRFLERLGRHPRHGLVLARANFGPEPTRSHVNAALTIGIDSPVERRRGFARRLLGIDLTRALSRVDVPVLVLVGAADAVVPPADSRRTVALIPGARMEIFEGAGHMLPFERSEQVVEQILALAAQIEAGSA